MSEQKVYGCHAHHKETGAYCEKLAGHEANHRGEAGNLIVQWPTDPSSAPSPAGLRIEPYTRWLYSGLPPVDSYNRVVDAANALAAERSDLQAQVAQLQQEKTDWQRTAATNHRMMDAELIAKGEQRRRAEAAEATLAQMRAALEAAQWTSGGFGGCCPACRRYHALGHAAGCTLAAALAAPAGGAEKP